ncbi:hypothetical protein JCM10207_008966 [Rhodosporidiobolus poonsookiae]
MRFFLPLFSSLSLLAAPALAAFGATLSGSRLTIDTGASLTFTLSTTTGDIRSIKYGGKELPDQSKFSHVASGLGSASVSYEVGAETVVVRATSTSIGGDITQYTIARKGENTIYHATRAASEPTVGELRFIYRLSRSTLPNGYAQSDVLDCGAAIEGEDVFLCSDQTRSKFYSSRQFIDDKVHGVSGDGVAAWMVVPGTGYEKSSGGPFFRDIDNQGSSQQELYFYMNSNHMQTEDYKVGLYGPYALVITDGSEPSADLDTSFMDSLGLRSYYAEADRGYVKGTASGVASEFGDYITVGWKTVHAQYWTRASSNGAFTSPAMIPGTYTQTLYKMELEVGHVNSVVVNAGQTITADVASSETSPSTIWTIGGAPDGTPRGFLNADKIKTMHPSDARMSSWGPVVFRIDSSSDAEWPMAQFKAVNDGNQVVFALSAEQAASAKTIEIGVTSSANGGRPQVTVNSYTGSAPAAPTKIDSRGITRGTWRGYNSAYTTTIPASALVEGENTATISVISGSGGDKFLSPSVVFDYLRFY